MHRLLILVVFIVFCCTYRDVPSGEPKQWPTKDIDINDDGTSDVKFIFSAGMWDGVGSSGGFHGATVFTLGDNSALYRRDAKMIPQTLFQMKGDTIRRNVRIPQEWNSLDAVLAMIVQAGDGKWPRTWTIQSQLPSGPYYVALKFRKGSEFLVGWIKVDIDINSGEVFLLDKAFTSNDLLVISR